MKHWYVLFVLAISTLSSGRQITVFHNYTGKDIEVGVRIRGKWQYKPIKNRSTTSFDHKLRYITGVTWKDNQGNCFRADKEHEGLNWFPEKIRQWSISEANGAGRLMESAFSPEQQLQGRREIIGARKVVCD